MACVRAVFFTADALRQFKRLPKVARALVKETIGKQLIAADPAATTRNKFRLRRVSEHADFELRAEPWRVFYRIERDRVLITLVGEKRGAELFVEGKEVKL